MQDVKLLIMTTLCRRYECMELYLHSSYISIARSLSTAKFCSSLALPKLSAAVLDSSVVFVARCSLTIGHHHGVTDGRHVCSLNSAARRLTSFHLALFPEQRCVCQLYVSEHAQWKARCQVSTGPCTLTLCLFVCLFVCLFAHLSGGEQHNNVFWERDTMQSGKW